MVSLIQDIKALQNSKGHLDGNKTTLSWLFKNKPELHKACLALMDKFGIPLIEALYLIYHEQPEPHISFDGFRTGYRFKFTDQEKLEQGLSSYAQVLLDSRGSLNRNFLNRDSYQIFPSLAKALDSFPQDIPLTHKLAFLIHGLTSYPVCSCGKRTSLISIKEGFRSFCSSACASKTEATKEKRKTTNFQRFGVSNFTKTESFRQIMKSVPKETYINASKKTKQTKLERYGDENYNNLDKIIKTNSERYGGNPLLLNIPEREAKRKQTNNLKFQKFLEKHLESRFLSWLPNQSFDGWFDKDHKKKYYKAFCHKCNKETLIEEHCRCLQCYPLYVKSFKETELLDFIKTNYQGEVIINARILDDPAASYKKEIDIYLPEFKLGFEFNGSFWHSALHKTQNFHQYKTQLAKAQGIQLIHIWEHDWLDKPDIVKSIVLNKLHRTPTTLYARQCQVKAVDFQEVRSFLNINHLHGAGRPWAYSLGLYYKDSLVSVLTVAKDGELLRFASRLNTNVVGGFARLFSRLKDKIKYTYAYEDLTPDPLDSVYSKLGFVYKRTTAPSLFFYNYKTKQIYNRQQFQKHKIKEAFPDYNGQPVKQFLLDHNITELYTTGNHYYEVKPQT